MYNDVTDTVNDVWPLKQNVGQYSYQKSRTSTYKDQRQTLFMPYRQEPPRFGYWMLISISCRHVFLNQRGGCDSKVRLRWEKCALASFDMLLNLGICGYFLRIIIYIYIYIYSDSEFWVPCGCFYKIHQLSVYVYIVENDGLGISNFKHADMLDFSVDG